MLYTQVGLSASRRLLELETNPAAFFEFIKFTALRVEHEDVEKMQKDIEHILNTQWGSGYIVVLCLKDTKETVEYVDLVPGDEFIWYIDKDTDEQRVRH